MKIKRPYKYWTKERCGEEALKYKTHGEFIIGGSSVLTKIYKERWTDLLSHLERSGDKFNRCIYSYEFSDMSVYVGLTYNIENRTRDRNKSKTDAVILYIKKTGLKPFFRKMTEFLPVDIAIEMEAFYVEDYRKNCWNILNIAKTGSIGSSKIWTKEKCLNVAKEAIDRKSFFKNNYGAYNYALTHGFLSELNSVLPPSKQKPSGYWNKERCREEFLKYKTKGEVKLISKTAYSVAVRNKWVDDLSTHMVSKKPRGYWTKEICSEIAKKYTTIKDFRSDYDTAYLISQRNGWLDEICQHMPKRYNKSSK